MIHFSNSALRHYLHLIVKRRRRGEIFIQYSLLLFRTPRYKLCLYIHTNSHVILVLIVR